MFAHAFTVQDLIDRSLTAFWKCQGCGACEDLDLPRIARERGPATILMNRYPPCRHCEGGRVFFYVRGGLAVQRQTTREADRQALIDDGRAISRDLVAKGFRRIGDRWVAPNKPLHGPAPDPADAYPDAPRSRR